MSVRVMARIWDDFPGDGPELLAMLAMGDMANDEGHCWPSMATIAKKIRRSRSQAQRVLHSLIEQGFVRVTDNANGGAPGTTRRYQIALERLTGRTDSTPAEEAEATNADRKTGRTHATGRVDATGSAGATGRMDAQDGSHGCDGRGRMDATQTIIEPSGTIIPSAPASPAPERQVDSEKSGSGAELFLVEQIAKADRIPPCKFKDIVDLYHEVLPELPGVQVFNEDRRRAAKGFWTWVLTSRRIDGTPRAQTADQALTYIRNYFERARDNDFLMGRVERTGKFKNWRCDFDFLLTERGKKHVIEKTPATA